MRLDPRDRTSWQGLFDLLQPPAGYRLSAAIGTSFGLSIDALTAALLSMCDADGEALAGDPVAGVMAITRLQSKVRVLVHPGTVAGSPNIGTGRVIALLDRLIVEVDQRSGLFHPKLWALRFERAGPGASSQPQAIGRVVVSSRNLSESTCFELGVTFQGVPRGDGQAPSPLFGDAAGALGAWLRVGKVRVPDAVWQLPDFIRQLTLDAPREASDALRLRWQGPNRQPLASLLPARIDRALVVSPFVRPDFVMSMLRRAQELCVVSTQEALDALDDDTFASLDALREAQGSPVLYQVADLGEPEGGHIDSVHAKLLLTEDAKGSATLVGSANATGPGWGIGSAANVEAMVEMRPGMGIDQFVAGFVRESRQKVHPWIVEYDRVGRAEPDSEKEMERQMLAALRQIAQIDFELRYDRGSQRLTLSPASAARSAPERESVEFDLAPLLLTDRPDVWTSLRTAAAAPCHFEGVPLDKVSAFVVIRACSKEPRVERRRLLLARLNLADSELDRRDAIIRDDIMATADPAAVLNALVRGLAYLSAPSHGAKHGSRSPGATIRQILQEANLERLLQAIATDPGLVTEMRLLLGPAAGAPFHRFCDDLEHVVKQVHAEAAL